MTQTSHSAHFPMGDVSQYLQEFKDYQFNSFKPPPSLLESSGRGDKS